MPLNVALALAAEAIVFAILLFGGAGTLAWPAGWAFMALFFIPGAIATALIARWDPALLSERMKPFNQEGQPVWDRIFLIAASAFFVAWLLLLGLDERFGWSATPAAVQGAGAAASLAGWVMVAYVFRENTFLAPVVKIQRERRQHVIATGPYAIVRHPMYAGMLVMMIGLALAAGSWWGAAAIAALAIAIGWRAVKEEGVLRRELEGYDAYAQRVRWRIVPGVW
jgi:protein-S-isoprenylcysteine O-methyltransferase Ste14